MYLETPLTEKVSVDNFDIENYPGLKEVLRSPPVSVLPLQEPPRKVKPLSHQMLRGPMRDYIIHKVKAPLLDAIIKLSKRNSWLARILLLIEIIRLTKRYPKVTRENCLNSNTLILFDTFDKFLEYEDNPGRIELFRSFFKLAKGEYEHDPSYRARMNFLIEELVEATLDGKWLPRGNDKPIDNWKEPKPFGLYQGRRFKSKITQGVR